MDQDPFGFDKEEEEEEMGDTKMGPGQTQNEIVEDSWDKPQVKPKNLLEPSDEITESG